METQVDQAVEAWIRWVPRWEPATHRGRVAPCRRCLGSPILSAVTIALMSALAHLVAVWAAVLFAAGDLITATTVAGDLVRGGASVVILLAAAIAGWAGIALRRTRAQQPRWPWERDDEE